MVDITIIVEGGAYTENAAKTVTQNTESLRRSLHRIFKAALGDEIGITVIMSTSNRNSVNQFLSAHNSETYLFTDLDGDCSTIKLFYDKLENIEGKSHITVPNESKERIFFMIQQMEAWILSQPNAIEKWGAYEQYIRKHKETAISDHKLLKGKHVENIKHSDEVLSTIISHFFNYNKNGVKKKVKYGKLKTSPSLLNSLDEHLLIEQTNEIKRFINYVQSH
ncbi:DUF4276 family protein [Prevotella sp. PINT]|jgi:hypothetical protein|uniref:DUF4276 family protein n=1 Tax=Palleniella intestinalis TaxID=2736291 RepID=UPI0015527811|nr:DUF4276 family protein [Palleniella intestinalis]NPD81624.1 DUF4276 family protein [Palleniella intestinalis]